MHKSCVLAGVICAVMFSSLLFASFACADSPTVGSDASDNGVETSNPALSPTELWNFTAANITAHTISLDWGSPVVANGIAYLRNTETYIIPDEPHIYLFDIPVQHMLGTIYALNASSGAKLWNLTASGSLRSLAIIDGVVYMSASDSRFTDGQSAGGNFYALGAVTGAQKWVYNIDGDIWWSSIVDGVIYVFVQGSGFNSYICAVKAANGEELWKWKADYYTSLSLPAVGDGAIYFGTYNYYYAVSSRNGTLLWYVAIDGSVSGSSTLVDGIVYFSSDTTTYALNAQNGDKLWSCTPGFAVSSCIVDGGIVYVSGDYHNVYAFDASNGKKVWNYSANEMTFSSLSLIDNVIYFSSNGTLSALNAANGMQLWSYNTDGNGPFTINDVSLSYYGYSTDATINDGVLYYYSGKTLYALDTSNGNSLWNYTTASNRSFLTVANNTAFFAAFNTVYALSVPAVVHPSSSSTAVPSGAIAATVTIATVAVIVAVIIVGIGLLVYFRKRNN